MKIKTIVTCALAALCLATFAQQGERRRRPDGETGGARMHRFSTTVERERPQLNEETRQLIAAYRRDPTEANKAALRKQVEANYEKVIERKKAKLEELKRSGHDQSRVKEMEERLDEMRKNREKRIDKMMSRFTDGQSRNANQQDDFSHGDAEARRHTPRRRDSASSGERSRPTARERRGEGQRGERGPRARRDRQGEDD